MPCQVQTVPKSTSPCATPLVYRVSELGPYLYKPSVNATLSGGFYSYSLDSAPLYANFFPPGVGADHTGTPPGGHCGGGGEDWDPASQNVVDYLNQYSLAAYCADEPTFNDGIGNTFCATNGATLNPYFCGDVTECRFASYAFACEKDTVKTADNQDKCTAAAFNIYQQLCMQILWPPLDSTSPGVQENRTKCCLGLDWAANTASATAWCAPDWNPLDPNGSCADVIASYCGMHSYSLDTSGGLGSGPWVHGFNSPTTTTSADATGSFGTPACGAWYNAAVIGTITAGPSIDGTNDLPLPKNRWPTIDAEIARYCDVNFSDIVSCACINYGMSSRNSSCQNSSNSGSSLGCIPYAYNTGAGQAPCADPSTCSATRASVVTQGTNYGIGVEDYVCIVPQCNTLTALSSHSLVPFDAWYAQRSGACPASCIQYIEGQTVNVGDMITSGGVNVGDMTGVCTNSTTNPNAPTIQMAKTQTTVVWVNQISNDCGLGLCEAQPTISFVNSSGNATLNYTITTAPLPAWMQWAGPLDSSGTVNSNETRQIALLIPSTADVAVGNHDFLVTVQDTVYTDSKAQTLMRVQAIPCQPSSGPSPLLPNVGQGISIRWTDVTAPWIPFVLAAGALVLFLLYLQYSAAMKGKKTVQHVQRDLHVLQTHGFSNQLRQAAVQDMLL